MARAAGCLKLNKIISENLKKGNFFLGICKYFFWAKRGSAAQKISKNYD